jgi:hypothetical protein
MRIIRDIVWTAALSANGNAHRRLDGNQTGLCPTWGICLGMISDADLESMCKKNRRRDTPVYLISQS